MSTPAVSARDVKHLPTLVDHAAATLAGARDAAEVLEARDMASLAYDVARRMARLNRAKRAHDDLIAAAHRAQADALEIEAQAKRRLADEYDAAQDRGDVQKPGGDRVSNVPGRNNAPTVDDIGLTRKEIHEARLVRDAEQADPGIIRRTLDEKLETGEEPTKTALRKAVVSAAMRGLRPRRPASRRNPHYVPPTPDEEAWRHVTGTFRAFAEWASAENLDRARRGKSRATHQPFYDLDVRAIRNGSIAFNTIREWIENE